MELSVKRGLAPSFIIFFLILMGGKVSKLNETCFSFRASAKKITDFFSGYVHAMHDNAKLGVRFSEQNPHKLRSPYPRLENPHHQGYPTH